MSRGDVFLPRPVALDDGGGLRLQVVDLVIWEGITNDPAPASGTLTLMTEPVEPGFYWRVERLTVMTEGATLPTCDVYASSPQPDPPATALRDTTRIGNRNVAEYPASLLVLPNTSLIFIWEGVEVGAFAFASVQYQLVARGG